MAANLQLDARESNISDAELAAYREVVNMARELPISLRIDLAQAMLQSVNEELPNDKPRTKWMDWVKRRPRSGLPAPSDEEMQQWLEEHYTEKYG